MNEQIRLFCNEEAPAAPPADAATPPDGGTPPEGAAPPVVDPASVMFANQHGQPLEGPADAGIVIPNASSVLAAAPVDHLTTYVNGLPMGQLEELADFICPRIDAGLSFEYEVEPSANQLGRMDNDLVGYNGLPGVIQLDPRTKGDGVLQFRGLEIPYGHTDQQLDATVPGRSVQQGEQRRSRRVNAFVERGRLARLIALMAANTSASNIDFSSDNDPINALDDEITAIAKTMAVPKDWVRILFGATGWKTLRQHAYLTGGGAFARQRVDRKWIAEQLELPEANIFVTTVQAITSKQGKTTAKDYMLGENTLYFFVQPPAQGGLPEDPGWAKTFAMRMKGAYKFVYRNVTHVALNVFNVGVAYYENMKVVDTSGIAQRTVSTT